MSPGCKPSQPTCPLPTAREIAACLLLQRPFLPNACSPTPACLQAEKSSGVVAIRMAQLKPRGSGAPVTRPRAEVRIKVRAPGGAPHTVVASGHLDEVQELAKGGTKLGGGDGGSSQGGGAPSLTLVEASILGEGAFSRVSQVTEESTGRTFALKRMTMTAALQCPEHVYCEQHISKVGARNSWGTSLGVDDPARLQRMPAAAGALQRFPLPLLVVRPAQLSNTPPTPAGPQNTANPFCIRQYASFKVGGVDWCGPCCSLGVRAGWMAGPLPACTDSCCGCEGVQPQLNH
jgi:hypothetical protein